MKVNATAYLTCRPLRFGFLLRPGNMQDLSNAVRTSNSLWGGRWSPMIPLFSGEEPTWPVDRQSDYMGYSITKNIIDRFDPDVIVPPAGIDIGNTFLGRHVTTYDRIVGQESSEFKEYGVGWLDVVRSFFNREFKFLRTVPIRLAIPNIPEENGIFWDIVVGRLPLAEVEAELVEFAKAERPDVNFDSLIDLLPGGFLLPKDLLADGVSSSIGAELGAHVFVLRPDEWLDLLDLWNYRALGVRLLPVPGMTFVEPLLGKLTNWISARTGGTPERLAILMRSRSVSEESFDSFVAQIRASAGPIEGPLCVVRQSPIPYWSTWKGQKSGSAPPKLRAGSCWQELRPVEAQWGISSELQPIAPEFIDLSDSGRRAPFAVDVELHHFGSDPRLARVIPSGDWMLTSRIHTLIGGAGRQTDQGLTIFGSHGRHHVTIDLPTSDAVITAWLDALGVKAEPSTEGRLATNMLSRLGLHDLHLIASRELTQLIREKAGAPSPVHHQTLFQIAQRETQAPGTPTGWLSRLVTDQVIQLGMQIKCPECHQKPWYTLDRFSYSLKCPFCHSAIHFPQHDPPKGWAYRFLGPFDVKDSAVASTCVLLTYRLLSGMADDHDGITASLGLNLEINGASYELDLLALVKLTHNREAPTIILGECKAGRKIADKDVDRMEALSRNFPDALLLFATIEDGFDEESVARLTRLVQRLGEDGQTSRHARVLVLGGEELFFKGYLRDDMFTDVCMRNAVNNLRWSGDWRPLCLESQARYLGRDLSRQGISWRPVPADDYGNQT